MGRGRAGPCLSCLPGAVGALCYSVAVPLYGRGSSILNFHNLSAESRSTSNLVLVVSFGLAAVAARPSITVAQVPVLSAQMQGRIAAIEAITAR